MAVPIAEHGARRRRKPTLSVLALLAGILLTIGLACISSSPGSDQDGDGILDTEDNCPTVSNAGQQDADGDNAGDACDTCPNDPNKTSPGQCDCGTADTDSDNDGTPDCNDQCPNDPNKTMPGLCNCGTVDTDSDNDGTPDCNDHCPNDPNKTAPGKCGCGFADTDACTFTLDLGGGVTMEMVRISGGSYWMGSMDGEGNDDEHPRHKVTITHDFYIGKYEVTQAQWQKIMAGDPADPAGNDQPVEGVTWTQCQSFCDAMKTQTGYNVHLPTEAQWEYACRAGTSTSYSFGDNVALLDQYAWFKDNSGFKTHPAGTKLPNTLGLYDMHGNVWEWCQDKYGPYSSADATDPTGASSSDTYVLRGGSLTSDASDLRSARRYNLNPGSWASMIGLRIALDVE